MVPTLCNCLKGIQHFLCSSLKYSTSHLAVIRNRILPTYSMVSVKKKPFSENVKAEKSLEIIGWTVINHPVCKLELTLKFDEGEKGSALTKIIFH